MSIPVQKEDKVKDRPEESCNPFLVLCSVKLCPFISSANFPVFRAHAPSHTRLPLTQASGNSPVKADRVEQGTTIYDVRSGWGRGVPKRQKKGMRLREFCTWQGGWGKKNPISLRTSYKYRPLAFFCWWHLHPAGVVALGVQVFWQSVHCFFLPYRRVRQNPESKKNNGTCTWNWISWDIINSPR